MPINHALFGTVTINCSGSTFNTAGINIIYGGVANVNEQKAIGNGATDKLANIANGGILNLIFQLLRCQKFWQFDRSLTLIHIEPWSSKNNVDIFATLIIYSFR